MEKKKSQTPIFENARRPEDIWNREAQHRWNGCKKHWRSSWRRCGETRLWGRVWISKRTGRVHFFMVGREPWGTKSESLVSSTGIGWHRLWNEIAWTLLVQRGIGGKTDQGIKPSLHETVCLSGRGEMKCLRSAHFFWLGDVKVKRTHTTLCHKENAHYLECRSRGWNVSCWAQERSGIKSEKKSLKMKPKLDAAQERRGIAENKRQRPGKIESAGENMTGVRVTEIEHIHNWRLQGRKPIISWHKRNI